MNQYSDYVMKYLSQSRMEDARRKAAGDRVCRQMRMSRVKGQRKGEVSHLLQILANDLNERFARASKEAITL